jgi:hypothetical protein
VPPWTLPAKFAMSGVISTVIASWWLSRFIFLTFLGIRILILVSARPEIHKLDGGRTLSICKGCLLKLHHASAGKGRTCRSIPSLHGHFLSVCYR